MTCPVCQTVNPVGARFCHNCGAPLTQGRAAEGERRMVTILFADVVGSTAWAERVDPEEWTEIMNAALQFMIAGVTRFEGTVARLMGDGLLALFGAPVAHEDDAERAVHAALEIRRAAAAYSATLAPRYGAEFAVRCGISTGLSVLAHVGDENRAEYTAMGDAANLAARLQALAAPQGIMIGPETHALVRHAFETRPCGEQVIKGKARAVPTYEVIRPLPERGTARGLEGIDSPFVGRAAELARLRRALEAARAGRPSILFVVGEAGLGKSRLLAELRRAAGEAVGWFEGHAISYARSVPYHPWSELLRTTLGLAEGAAEAEVEERLRALHMPAAAGEEGAPDAQPPAWFGVLATLLGLEGQTRPPANPEEASQSITAAVATHLRRLGEDRPVVAVLDDVHWADHASVALLETLAGALTDEPLLVLCPMRPERNTPAFELLERIEAGKLPGDRVGVIQVRPLDRGSSEALLGEMLAVEGMPAATRAMILEKAEGNPFYLEEVIRSLIDSGHIVRREERWVAQREIVDVTVPDTLSGVIAARMDRLPERGRQVAQTASAIGREFASRLLSAVMKEPAEPAPPDLEPQLGDLTVEGLLSEVAWRDYLGESDERPAYRSDYRFKHEFTREAAYERLLLRRRRELHGRIGEELEALLGGRADVAKDLAHHYLLGERWLKAARWSLAAARAAKLLYSLPEATELVEGALTALDRLAAAAPGEGADDDARRLRAAVVTELVTLGIMTRTYEDPERRPALVARAEEAVGLARELDDPRALVTSLVNLGNIHVLSGFPGTGFGSLMEAHDLALELGDDKLFLMPLWVATEIMLDDAPAAAIERFDEVIEMARKVGSRDIEAHALGSKTAALARLGEFNAALELSPLALEAAEASGSIIKRADVNLLVGSAYLEMGRLESGLEHLERGTGLALSVNGFECACNGLHLLGLGQLAERHLSEAQDSFELSIDYATGTALEAALHNFRASLAGARFQAGDLAATEAIEKEIANAEAVNDGYGAARARLTVAEALIATGQPERAEGHARRAIEWLKARHMEPYVLKGLRLMADALAAEGDAEGSADVQREAEELRAHISWPPPDAERGAGRAPGAGGA